MATTRERSPFERLYGDALTAGNGNTAGRSRGGVAFGVVEVKGATTPGDGNNNLETTFQFDEDTESVTQHQNQRQGETDGHFEGGSGAVTCDNMALLRKKHKAQQKMKRKQRMSQSLSQPKFADHYRYTGDSFLGCGSYGSVYTCSSLKGSADLTKVPKSPNKTQEGGSVVTAADSVESAGSRARSRSCVNRIPGGPNSGGSQESEASGVPARGSADVMSSSTSEEYYSPRRDDQEDEGEGEEEFAVKIIDKEGHSRTRVFNEIEILHQCKGHPNIVQLLDFYEEDLRFLLIFEKVNGGTLLDYLYQGPFGERESSLVSRDISTALLFLHAKGIAHRDLKPANILCVYPHSVAPVKICDFDLASAPWSRDDSQSSLSNYSADSVDLLSPVGSAEYMAPEVVNVFIGGTSAGAYDKRCDLWSLGVILYIMLSGYPPFIGNCGFPCGWEDGRSCTECQCILMHAIQTRTLVFPSPQWDGVSPEAISLLQGLLQRDIHKRVTAQQVLHHDWLRTASAAASDPIPLDSTKLRRRNARESKGDPYLELSFIPKYRKFNEDGTGKQGSLSPDERQRLGTEDSGFEGDSMVSGVVGLLMEAVNDDDDEGNQSMITVNESDDHFFQITNEEINDSNYTHRRDNQFDLSDEESLFSSGYGLSLDLPPGDFRDIIEEASTSSDNFVAVNYARSKNTPMNQDALCSMFEKFDTVQGPSRKNSSSSTQTTVLSDGACNLVEA